MEQSLFGVKERIRSCGILRILSYTDDGLYLRFNDCPAELSGNDDY